MSSVLLNSRTFGFILGTRMALGFGIGLLVADRLPARRRRALSAALTAFGAATTIPAVVAVIRGSRQARRGPSTIPSDPQLVGATRFPRKGDDDWSV